jgi:hypothetical protein
VQRRAGQGSQPGLGSKIAASSAPLGGKAAPPKPRRALGDITNKNGKEALTKAAGLATRPAPAQTVTVKLPLRSAPPPDFDKIERMFPVEPAYVSLDLSGIDLDSVIDTVLAYEPDDSRSRTHSLSGALDGDGPPEFKLPALATDVDLAPEPAGLLADAPDAAPSMHAGMAGVDLNRLPESVEVDPSGAVSDDDGDASEAEMELD